MYAVMFRTKSGENVMMKARYISIDDAESCVIASAPSISDSEWQRCINSSTLNLGDGSSYVIFEES